MPVIDVHAHHLGLDVRSTDPTAPRLVMDPATGGRIMRGDTAQLSESVRSVESALTSGALPPDVGEEHRARNAVEFLGLTPTEFDV